MKRRNLIGLLVAAAVAPVLGRTKTSDFDPEWGYWVIYDKTTGKKKIQLAGLRRAVGKCPITYAYRSEICGSRYFDFASGEGEGKNLSPDEKRKRDEILNITFCKEFSAKEFDKIWGQG